jgi:2-polyprenyl-3-methyl-5-hydroxy-6-metoxy-1,4-benzoquinol methylase
MTKFKSDSEIFQLVWQAYRDAPLSVRLLSSSRSYICPVQPLVAEVPIGSTVFDIGCGSGLFLSLLIADSQVEQAIGSDINYRALSCARKAAKRLIDQQGKNIPVDFIHSTTPRTWPRERFSVVSLIDVMHHVPPQQQQSFFQEAVQRVAPGGTLLYKDMCEHPPWKAAANRLHDLLLARQWINYVPLNTIKKWASNSGLELQKEEHYSRLFYGHEKLVFKAV